MRAIILDVSPGLSDEDGALVTLAVEWPHRPDTYIRTSTTTQLYEELSPGSRVNVVLADPQHATKGVVIV